MATTVFPYASRPLEIFYPKPIKGLGSFYFQRLGVGRAEPICAFCTLLVIFLLKVCAKLHLDFFPLLWYNIYVKRETSCREINLQVMEIGNLVYSKRTDTKGLGRKVSEIRKIYRNDRRQKNPKSLSQQEQCYHLGERHRTTKVWYHTQKYPTRLRWCVGNLWLG